MGNLERPYLERRPGDAPSSCPVCGAATRPLAQSLDGTEPTATRGAITCRAAGPDHFEWWPSEQRRAHVVSERVDRMRCISCHAQEDDGGRVSHEPECAARVLSSGRSVHDPRPGVETGADNRRYDKSSTTPHSPPKVESWLDLLHRPDCPALNRSGDCTCPPVRSGTKYPRPDDVVVIEAEVLGVDYRTAVASRLAPDVARFAAAHAPIYGRPVRCAGCVTATTDGDTPRITWPCQTAWLALEMMRLTTSDIAITSRPS